MAESSSSEGESKELPYQTKFTPDDHYKKMYDYDKLTYQGSNLLLNNNFAGALKLYKKTLFLAQQLNDDYKINEALCNIGITYFYSGKLKEAINNIKKCYDYIYSICNSEIGNNNIRNLYLLCKSGSNLSMCQLTKNSENNNSVSLIENIIYILSKEKDLYKKKYCIQNLNNIIFRANTLLTDNNYFIDKNYLNNQSMMIYSNEVVYNRINQLFIKAFDSFIATNKIKQWINSLNIIYKQMKLLNDQPGIAFTSFNLQLAILLKNKKNDNNNIIFNNNEETVKAKRELGVLLKEINQSNNYFDDDDLNHINPIINEDYIDDIIEDYIYKISTIREIYKLLKSFEDQISENVDNNYHYIKNSTFVANFNTDYCLKLLFKYTKQYFIENIQDMNLKNGLIKYIDNTLDLIESKKIDVSQLNLPYTVPEITQSLTSIINNLISMYRYHKLLNAFERLKKMKKTRRPPDYKLKTKDFLQKAYSKIIEGEFTKKINYGNDKTKIHFYKINKISNNILFQSFDNPNSIKPIKSYDFRYIKLVIVGIRTNNALRKLKYLNFEGIKTPYLFLSLVLESRTIDLVLKDEKSAKNWFYGLYYYCKQSRTPYKICSCTSYILFRIKCKVINELYGGNQNYHEKRFSRCLLKYLKNNY